MYLDIIARPFRIKLVAGISLFLLVLILINAAFFYYHTDYGLGDVYVNKVFTASQFKAEIIKEALSIYGVFALICLLGIVAVVIFDTHRVVGPLVSVKRVVTHISEGSLDAPIHFRKNDAVHPLAEALNDLTGKYRERHSRVCEAIDDLYRDTYELSLLIQKGDSKAIEDKRLKMAEKAEEVNRWLSEIKV